MELVFENIFINWSVMMRADVIKAINGYRNYPTAEDYDLAVRLAHTYPMLLLKYYSHEPGISQEYLQELRQDMYVLGGQQDHNLLQEHSCGSH